jgi:hypothetical protein
MNPLLLECNAALHQIMNAAQFTFVNAHNQCRALWADSLVDILG